MAVHQLELLIPLMHTDSLQMFGLQQKNPFKFKTLFPRSSISHLEITVNDI